MNHSVRPRLGSMDPRRLWLAVVAVAVAGTLAAALGIGVRATPDEPVAVDEPQYLLTAQSIARDGDLDISNQLAQRSWREFTQVEPPPETVPFDDGSQVSPHDPLLPILLAVPTVFGGGYVAAKLVLSLLAGALAALLLWTAVRRYGVPLPLATIGVGTAAVSAPLAVYGQQIYPELPAGLACLAGVVAFTGSYRRRNLVLLALAVAALAWLSVKYVPVAAVLALLGVIRWWRAGRTRDAFGLVGALGVLAVSYALIHLAVWKGLTVYASGDHFTESGQLGVMGDDPDYLFRSWRLIDLLVDSRYGLVAWQPAWLLLVPALAGLLATCLNDRRAPAGRRRLVLLPPLAVGWLVATYPALTMHGYWWPGRQLVVVLPLAVLVILTWLAGTDRWVKPVAAGLGAVGVITYASVLVAGHRGELTWVRGFFDATLPTHQLLVPLLADYGDSRTNPVTTSNLVWLGVLAALAAIAYVAQRRRGQSPDQPISQTAAQSAAKNSTGPATDSPTTSSAVSR